MTNSLRNVALVAHVDHGKTTLVDTLLRSTGAFASHAAVIDRVMDSDDQERERGITIARRTVVKYREQMGIQPARRRRRHIDGEHA